MPHSPHQIIDAGLCIGCGSCAANSDGAARMKLDAFGHFKPRGDTIWLHQATDEFARTCPFSPVAHNETQIARELYPDAPHSDDKIGRFEAAYVGYVATDDFRARGSSGGLVTWVAHELLRRGLVDGVAHVIAADDPQRENRFFRYRIARSLDEVRDGAKSRYYPVELSSVIEQIRATPGRYAVVGVPCFIKALQLLRREDTLIRERVAFTLGLFCGHMKSARLVESFAWQMNVSIEDVARVEFRLKDAGKPASWYTAHLTMRDGQTLQKDWWNLCDGDWGAGFFQNSACNYCDDVVAETADVSFGDAWVEPYSSDGRGTNVVIVRAPVVAQVMSEAIDDGRLHLENVDAKFISDTQAAGFRQRREGLAFRLHWRRRLKPMKLQPRKRVRPHVRGVAARRQLIYTLRAMVTAGSNRIFWLARLVRRPRVYIKWAGAALAVYHGLAYGRGALMARLGLERK